MKQCHKMRVRNVLEDDRRMLTRVLLEQLLQNTSRY
jgi:hypothetical protein